VSDSERAFGSAKLSGPTKGYFEGSLHWLSYFLKAAWMIGIEVFLQSTFVTTNGGELKFKTRN